MSPKEKGFIPAYRHIFDPEHELAPTDDEPASRLHAWLDLCQMAQHKDGHRQNGVVLNRGEVVVSQRMLARRWCWHRSKVRRFIVNLAKSDPPTDPGSDPRIAAVRDTHLGTVYRIVKYDEYAVIHRQPGDVEKHTDRPTQRPTQRPTTDPPPTQEQPYNHKTTTTGGRTRKTKSHPIPDDWKPNDTHRQKASALGVNVEREAEKFIGHHGAKGTTYKNWDQAFRNWLAKAAEFQERDRRRSAPPERKIRIIGGTRFYR